MFLNDVAILQFTKIVLPSENIRLNQGCKANPNWSSRSNMSYFAIIFYSFPSHFSNVERYIFIYFFFQQLWLMFHLYLAFNIFFFTKNVLNMLNRILRDAVWAKAQRYLSTSEVILDLPPTARATSMVYLRWVLNHKPSASQPSPQ